MRSISGLYGALLSVIATNAASPPQFARWVRAEMAPTESWSSRPSAYPSEMPTSVPRPIVRAPSDDSSGHHAITDVAKATPQQQFANWVRNEMAAYSVVDGASAIAADKLMIPILEANTSGVNVTIDGHKVNLSATEARSVMVSELKRLMLDGLRKKQQQPTERSSQPSAYPTEMPTSVPRSIIRAQSEDGWGHYEASDKSFRELGLANPDISAADRSRLGMDPPVFGTACMSESKPVRPRREGAGPRRGLGPCHKNSESTTSRSDLPVGTLVRSGQVYYSAEV
jgi:hypothetical protein